MKRLLDFTMSKFSSNDENAKRQSSFKPRRKATCTHVTVTRLYGQHRCVHCNEIPCFGFVYRCTQDTGGELPMHDSEFETREGPDELDLQEQVQAVLERSSLAMSEYKDPGSRNIQLKPWMETAIQDGAYSSEQIETLKAQRLKVETCIEDTELARQLKETYMRVMALTPTSSASETTSLPIDGSQSESDVEKTDQNEYPQVTSTNIKSRKCRYQTCWQCKPSSRDRSWQCYDHVFEKTARSIDIAYDNRPVSNVLAAQRLGLRVENWRMQFEDPHDPCEPRNREFRDIDWNATRGDDDDPSGASYQLRKLREKPRFRQSLRQAFRVARNISQKSSRSQKSTKSQKSSKSGTPGLFDKIAESVTTNVQNIDNISDTATNPGLGIYWDENEDVSHSREAKHLKKLRKRKRNETTAESDTDEVKAVKRVTITESASLSSTKDLVALC